MQIKRNQKFAVKVLIVTFNRLKAKIVEFKKGKLLKKDVKYFESFLSNNNLSFIESYS